WVLGYGVKKKGGVGGVVGGSVRYRLYNAWRLTAVEIAKVIAFCTISFWLGFVLLGGTFFIIAPPLVPATVHLPFGSVRLLGLLLLLPSLLYIGWIAIRRKPIQLRQWDFQLP